MVSGMSSRLGVGVGGGKVGSGLVSVKPKSWPEFVGAWGGQIIGNKR